MRKNFQERNAPLLSLVHSLQFENGDYFTQNFMNTKDLNYLGVFIDFSCEGNSLIEEVINKLIYKSI